MCRKHITAKVVLVRAIFWWAIAQSAGSANCSNFTVAADMICRA